MYMIIMIITIIKQSFDTINFNDLSYGSARGWSGAVFIKLSLECV